MQTMNLAQRIRNKEFVTNEQISKELKAQLAVWQNSVEVDKEVHTFLGFTFPEFCSVTYSSNTILDLFNTGQILVNITEDQLNSLYVEWCQIPSPRHERFGQYVYNQVKFEKDSSYSERDPEKAYNILLGACTLE